MMLNNYQRLFSELEIQGVKYCSWKNNHLLERESNGDGDIDLLVHPLQYHEFERLLFSNGFIRAESSISEYPFIKHYYCYDECLNKFGHLHVYFKLVTGDSHLKNYRLPIEDKVLNASYISDFSIREAHPFHQAEIYMLRKYIKSSSLFGLFLLFRESEDYKSEFNYIKGRVAELGAKSAPSLFKFDVGFSKPPSFVNLLKIKRYIKVWHRGVGVIERVSQLNTRILNKLFFHRKKIVNGGVIAVVGLDGSGKSSAVEMLSKWLSKEFTIKIFHFGRPPATLLTYPIRIMLWVRRVVFLKNASGSLVDSSNNKLSLISKIRYLALAFERVVLMRNAHRFSLNGGIAILDRYPSNNIGKMDSQRIPDLNSFFGRLESTLYESMKIADMLLKFNVDVEEAVRRNSSRIKKDKETDEEIRIRFNINDRLQYSSLLEHEIDAMQPKDEVHKQLKALVWGYIVATN
jgi:thymidylate kinase